MSTAEETSMRAPLCCYGNVLTRMKICTIAMPFVLLLLADEISMKGFSASSQGSINLSLRLAKTVLASMEINVVECDIISGQQENVSLWKNNELLAQTLGTYLQYQLMPSQFGTFRCQTGSISITSLSLEIAKFQLIFESIDLINCEGSLKNAVQVGNLIKTVCEECRFESLQLSETTLECSKTGRLMYFTTYITYSNSDGTITASTLISMLLSWLLAETAPTIIVAGVPLPLSKMCPTPVDKITLEACRKLFSDDFVTSLIIPVSSKSGRYIDSSIAFGFFLAGSISGIATAVASTFLIIFVNKYQDFSAKFSVRRR